MATGGSLGKLVRLIRENGIYNTFSYLKHTATEKYYEKHYGIDSWGYLGASDLQIKADIRDNPGYQGMDYLAIFKALNHLKITSKDIFLDYGSGKGRVLVVAASYPFQEVIGVEISPELNKVANDNIKKASRRIKCPSIKIIEADATKYEFPNEVTVVLMYNPFIGETMKTVIKKIETSIKNHPRSLAVIFKFPDWSTDPLANHPLFKLVTEFSTYTTVGEKLRIYKHYN